MKNILLDKNKLVVFMGSMNAFPMMYALQLKKYGYDVVYLVDSPQKDTLSRPENHYPSISYPYPDWIIEWTLPLQIILLLCPRYFSLRLQAIIKKKNNREIGCFVLNGFFISLSPYLPDDITIVALSHGSDLDVWANINNMDELKTQIFQSNLGKVIPSFFKSHIIKNFILKERKGFIHSDFLLYLPPNFNQTADKLISEFQQKGVTYIPRFHASFASLTGQNRTFRENNSKLRIFSGVRFLYKNFPRGNKGYNKGNDQIIKGLAKFYKYNKNITIDFVEKGTDLEEAKSLCDQEGLSPGIKWHKEMPFNELLTLYQQSDICFDQVGQHWIGAIGFFALWLGKPLIANDTNFVASGFWPKVNPVCTACNADEVYQWLTKLADKEFRKKISRESKIFADQYLDMENHPNAIFQLT